MHIRSRAPLRIGLAGGGTDLESYFNNHGGYVLNAAVSMYAYCTIYPTTDNRIYIQSYDNKNSLDIESIAELPIQEDHLILHRGVYNYIVKHYNDGKPLSFKMYTSNDAPVGSGLGTSSTMVVAILEAFSRWLHLDLNDYKKAEIAYLIERKELNLAGGKQDQYAAVFGGFNFIEFRRNGGGVVVHPLKLPSNYLLELECSMLLCYSNISRKSAQMQMELANNIIRDEVKNTKEAKNETMDAMLKIKENASFMKDCVLTGDFEGIKRTLRETWENKKRTSASVTNENLEKLISHAMCNGAEAVKVSGAGGGGFLLLFCNPINRQKLFLAMQTLGNIYPVDWSKKGVESWVVHD